MQDHHEHALSTVKGTSELSDMLLIPDTVLPPGVDPRDTGILDASGDLTITGALVVASIHDTSLPHLLIHYRRFELGHAEAASGQHRPAEELLVEGPLSSSIPELAEGLIELAPARLHDASLSCRLFEELLVNAIGHRSFAPEHLDRSVLVTAYSDRIAFVSPGPLADQVSLVDGSLRGRRSRSPHLMALLSRQGLARQANTGQAWIRRLAPKLGYTVSYEADNRSVTAWLVVDPDSVVDADSRLRAKERRLRLPANPHDRRVMEILEDGQARSRAELQRLLGIADSTIGAVLRRLVKLGHIETTEKHRRSPKQRYRKARKRS